MKKVLIVTTNIGFFRFLKNDIDILNSKGYEIHIASNKSLKDVDMTFDVPVKIHDICFSRNPVSPDNIQAFRHLYALVNHYDFDMIHCHTPVAAALTRLSAIKARKKGTKVIYTAHGFHFYKGAPLKMWLMFYPIEKYLSRYTDILVTINTEDYDRAYKKFNTDVRYIHGVGVDVDRFKSIDVDQDEKRLELGIKPDDRMLLSVGELNDNKNHISVIKAMDILVNDIGIKNIHYFVAGEGTLKDYLIEQTDSMGLGDNVHLLGYREDVDELLKAADIYMLPSYREGLNVSMMESMASGLPVICSDIRGNEDLIDKYGGIRVKANDISSWAVAIRRMLSDAHIDAMGRHNQYIIDSFSIDKVKGEIASLYY